MNQNAIFLQVYTEDSCSSIWQLLYHHHDNYSFFLNMFFIWACDGEKKLQQQNKWETALMAPIRTRFSARHCLANSHVIRRVWHVIANASILFHVSPFAVNWNPLFLARTTWVQFNSVDWDQSEPIASSLGFISISASFVSLSGCLNWKSKKKLLCEKTWEKLTESSRIR